MVDTAMELLHCLEVLVACGLCITNILFYSCKGININLLDIFFIYISQIVQLFLAGSLVTFV